MGLEGDIASGLGIIATVLTLFSLIGLLVAYLTGNIEGMINWLANFLKDAAIATPYILLIGAIVGIFSATIAAAVRSFSPF